MENLFNAGTVASTLLALFIFLAFIYFMWGNKAMETTPATTTTTVASN